MKIRQYDYLFASFSVIFSSGVLFFYNLYVKKYVLPYEYGIFTTANLFLLYLGYTQFGVLNSFNRDYPRMLGEGDVETASHTRNVVFTYLMIISIICVVGGGVLVIFLSKLNLIIKILGVGIFVNSVLVGMNYMVTFLDVQRKSEGKVISASFIVIVKSLALFIVGYFLVRQYTYYGLFIALLISSLIPIILNTKQLFKFRVAFDSKMIASMIQSGLPLLITSLIWTIMMSIDKLVILRFMTMTELGIYSTALMGFSAVVLVPNSFSQIFYIKMSIKYGESGSSSVLMKYADYFTLIISVCSAYVALIAYYALPLIVNKFIPNYVDGVPATKILILGVSLFSTTVMYSNIFSVLKLNKELLKYTSMLCVFNLVFSTGLVLLLGKEIEYVAIGTSLAYGCYSLILIVRLAKLLKRSMPLMLLHSWVPVLTIFFPTVVISKFFTSAYLEIFVSLLVSFALLIIGYLIFHKYLSFAKD